MRAFVCTLVALCVMVTGAPSDMEESRKIVEQHLAPPEVPLPSPSPRDATLCQRHSLNVSFTNLGWDWIISPLTYDAGYCAGRCSFTNLSPYNFIVRTRDEVPKPCCMPTKLESMNMVYYDHDKNVVVGNVINMKVKSCGCR